MRILLIFFSLLLLSCEDVIDLDLNEGEPKLVVEATMFRLLNNEGGSTEITLSLTSPFFDNEIPPVTDALVIITDSNNNVFSFTHTGNGRYITDTNLIPEDNVDYTITISYQGETFTATEQIESVVPWEDIVEQDNEGGFFGDEIELKAFFNDPADEDNFYFFQISSIRGRNIDIASDEFFDGNRIFALYTADDLQPGDQVLFEIDGVDRNYYDFQFVLLQQGSDDGGGPFETQPATVRGNVINVTNPDNFPLGYFRVSERDTLTYTVQ